MFTSNIVYTELASVFLVFDREGLHHAMYVTR